jgi:hypothetical protein
MRGENSRPLHETTVRDNSSGLFTATETEVYDRQLRLWGHKAQGKLLKGRILIAVLPGTSSPLLWFELAKNLILAGLGHLLVSLAPPESTADCDPPGRKASGVPDEHGKADSKPSAYEELRTMNPFVSVEEGPDLKVLCESVAHVRKLALDAVCMVSPLCPEGASESAASAPNTSWCEALSAACAAAGVSCYIAAHIGYFGAFFTENTQDHTLRTANDIEARSKNSMSSKAPRPAVKRFRSGSRCGKNFSCERAQVSMYASIMAFLRSRAPLGADQEQLFLNRTWQPFLVWQTLRKCLQSNEVTCISDLGKKDRIGEVIDALRTHLYLAELWRDTFIPVAKILGGIWALEVIKTLAGIDETERTNNFFFYDGIIGYGSFVNLVPEDSLPLATICNSECIQNARRKR